MHLLRILLYLIQIMSASNGVLTGMKYWLRNKISFLFYPWLKDIWLYWGWTEAYMLILGKRNLACHWSVSEESKSDKPEDLYQVLAKSCKVLWNKKQTANITSIANWCKGEKKGPWPSTKCAAFWSYAVILLHGSKGSYCLTQLKTFHSQRSLLSFIRTMSAL